MRFSVVIAVYNKEKHLSKTIESVLQQSVTDIEIIIINDGSTDGSEAIIKGFKDSRIVYFKQENKGVSEARNLGIKKATTPFIALLDADDIWYSNYLEQMSFLIDCYPNEHVFACACEIETKTKTLRPSYSNLSLAKDETTLLDYFSSSYLNTLLTSSSTIIKKSAFDTIGLYNKDIKSGEDTDLWIRIGIHYQIAFLNSPLATYTYEASSLSNEPIKLENRLDLDAYESYTSTNKGLKKFLDLNRYSLAIIAKRTGNTHAVKTLKQQIVLENLNRKQRFLLEAPAVVIKGSIKIKQFLEKIGISLSTYK